MILCEVAREFGKVKSAVSITLPKIGPAYSILYNLVIYIHTKCILQYVEAEIFLPNLRRLRIDI